MALKKHRKVVTDTLSEHFSLSKAKQYEKDIYEMCKDILATPDNLTEVYVYYAYEKVGQLISAEKDPSEVLKDIKAGNTGKESFYCRQFLQPSKKSFEESYIRFGVYPCRDYKCRARRTKETISYGDQQRRGDEGMAIVIECKVCGLKYNL